MIITLHNDFHDRAVNVRPISMGNGQYKISKRAAARAKAALCGCTDCACSGDFGQRGKSPIEIVGQDARNYIVQIVR